MNQPASFSRRFRLTRKADFEAVFDSGRRSADSLFTVLYRSSELTCPRLGMTASARRVPTAVARNRIRRLIRESFRQARGSFTGIDIVVIVREGAAAADNASITSSLAAHWQRLRKAGRPDGADTRK